jgi:hypothetical protein
MPGASLNKNDIADLARLLGGQPVFIGLNYLEKCDQSVPICSCSARNLFNRHAR